MLHVRDLRKTFRPPGRRGGRQVEAVRGVDCDVDAGEIVGFLGPNGAGKTTTLRMLTTALTPTSGQATVAGHDLLRDPLGVRRSIGSVPQGGTSNGNATVREELVLQARLHRFSRADAERRAAALMAQLDLDGLGDRRTKTLSGGQRRRLDIAMGLVHAPPLVFLDEPTTGLDPQSRANLWDHIRSLRAEHAATVFLTTHYLEEADALCDRILVIDDGRIVAEGTPDELKRRVAGDVVTLELRRPEDVERARAAVGSDPQIRDVLTEQTTLRLTVEHGERSVLPLVRQLDGAGLDVLGFSVSRPTLDDVFLAVTGRSLRESDVVDERTPVSA
ncbi:MAG TPA: ABC transporter ATP-binding protein [Egibacteraceae bacterium]